MIDTAQLIERLRKVGLNKRFTVPWNFRNEAYWAAKREMARELADFLMKHMRFEERLVERRFDSGHDIVEYQASLWVVVKKGAEKDGRKGDC